MKVSNMTSSNGNPVPNQFLLTGIPAGSFYAGETRAASGDMFQSYKHNIAYRDFRGLLYMDILAWDYSKPTSKYRNQFTGLTTAQTKAGIADGSIILTDLN